MERKSSAVIILSLFLMSSLAIAGCGSNNNSNTASTTDSPSNSATEAPAATDAPAEKVNITYWHTWAGGEDAYMQQIVDEFNNTHPNIHVDSLGSQTTQTELTAITGGNSFDVGYTQYSNVAKWAEVGALSQLDDSIAKTGMDTADVVQSVWDIGQYNDKQFAIPYTMDTFMLYYNKDLFAKAGITTPPTTISELQADALKLTIKDGSDYSQLGFIPDYPWLDVVVWRNVFGASLYDADTKTITADSPENIADMNFYKSFYSDPYDKEAVLKFKSGFGNYQSPNNAFFQGQLAMSVEGQWLQTFIKDYAPDLNYGVAALPYPDDHPELKDAGEAQPGMLVIPEQSKNKEAAWEFVNYLVSKDPYVKFSALKGSLPTTLSALNDPALIEQNPGLEPFVKYIQGPNIKAFPAVPFMTEFFAALTEGDTSVINLEKTPEEAMKGVVEKVQPLVK